MSKRNAVELFTAVVADSNADSFDDADVMRLMKCTYYVLDRVKEELQACPGVEAKLQAGVEIECVLSGLMRTLSELQQV